MANKKCPNCNSCMDFHWVENNVYYFCWLCNKYYVYINKKFVEVEKP